MMKCARLLLFVVVTACLACGCAWHNGAGEFTRPTIDIGVVVSDLDAAAAFYTEAIGFTEAKGFSVTGEFAGGSGLTPDLPIDVRVFTLADCPGATKLKLMTFDEAPGKKVDNSFISSSLGFSYLTIFVSDTTAALARLDRAAVAPVKPPYPVNDTLFLTLVKDPDGNIVELLGPKSPE